MLIAQVLRYLSSRQSSESHTPEAAGRRRILIVEQASKLACSPQTWNWHIVGGEDSGVKVGLDTTVSVSRQSDAESKDVRIYSRERQVGSHWKAIERSLDNRSGPIRLIWLQSSGRLAI